MKRYVAPAALCAILLCAHATGQTGTWKTFTSMQSIRDMAVKNGAIWAATAGGVFRYDQRSGIFTSYTNVEGLSSIDIRAVALDEAGRVFVGASSGAINMFETGRGWTTIPDIARATDKPQRGINVLRARGGRIYIGTDFGISIYNPDNREFAETWLKFGALPSQTPVQDIIFIDNTIYVATSEGIARADLRSSNLQDPLAWTSYSGAEGLPSKNVFALAPLNGRIIAGTEKGAALLENDAWVPAFGRIGLTPLIDLLTVGDTLYLLTVSQMYRAVSTGDAVELGDPSYDARYGIGTRFACLASAQQSGFPGDFILGSTRGFSRSGLEHWSFLRPDGPIANQIAALAVDDSGSVWAASPGSGASSFNGRYWSEFSTSSNPPLPTNDVQVLTGGPDGAMYLGTWGSGVVRRSRDGSLTQYNRNTYPEFPGIPENPAFAAIAGIASDSKGNIWFVHHRGNNGRVLSCLARDGTLRTYRNPFYDDAYVYGLAIDQFGAKWMWGSYQFTGVITFNDNATLDVTADDTWLKVNATSYFADRVNTTVSDGLGDIWVGTPLGPRTVYNPKAPEKSARTCYNTRCNLEGLVVNCIAIDPVNNKWLGTTSGVFVLSSDGSTIIEQYTVDNSPLVDNNVTAIVIQPSTGDAYFGTNKGISRLSTPFVQAAATGTDLDVAPNPFRPEIDGQAMIDGLAEGSTLKILTVSGDAVREIFTPGGRIGFWDGKTNQGEYVASGIYFIVAFQPDGGEARIGKIAVVRE